MNAWGYTAINSIAPHQHLSPAIYREIQQTDKLTAHIATSLLIRHDNPEESLEKLKTLRDMINNEEIRVVTAKYLIDGVVEGNTAYLKEPYDEAAGLGKNYNAYPEWTCEKLEESFEAVRRYAVNNFGSTTSINNLYGDLRKNGHTVSRQTLAKYIQTLVDAKILYECDRFDMKSRKSLAGDKKYYIADLSFYFALNTDNRINYGPVLENTVFFYAKSLDYAVSVGRIGKLECDFILRDPESNYSYVQVAYTVAASKETEDREYRPLEQIKDAYPKYVATADYLLQKRNGVRHVNLAEFMKAQERF